MKKFDGKIYKCGMFLIGVIAVFSLTTMPTYAEKTALDNGVSACGVPFCDIEQALISLQQDYTPGEQRSLAKKLAKKYRNENDLEVLNNLYHFADGMLALFTSIHKEEWILNSAKNFLDQILTRMMKISDPNSPRLTEYYKKMSSSGSRSDALKYWLKKVPTISTTSEILNLIQFAKESKKHGRSIGDASWMIRRATRLIVNLTVRLNEIDPVYEGIYEVKIAEGNPAKLLPFDRIIVLETGDSWQNLMVTFYNKRLKRVIHSFGNVGIEGNLVSGVIMGSDRLAVSFEFNFERSSRTITGRVVDTTMATAVAFSGKQTFSTEGIFPDKVPASSAIYEKLGKVPGTLTMFSGKLGKVPGTLMIKSFVKGIYSATFTTLDGKDYMHFQGRHLPEQGVLALTSNNDFKLFITLKDDGGNGRPPEWKGLAFGFKKGIVSYEVSFTEISSI